MKEFSVETILKTSWGKFEGGDTVVITDCDGRFFTGRINSIFGDADTLTLDMSEKHKSKIKIITFEEIKLIELVKEN